MASAQADGSSAFVLRDGFKFFPKLCFGKNEGDVTI